jgi:transcriptional regulator with XRE-family HTH domain
MELRERLADRLRDLMDAHPNLDTQTKLAAHSRVSQSTIQRLLALEQSATIDVLDRIAKAFRMSAWELIIPDLQSAKMTRDFSKLSDTDKQRLMHFMEFSLATDQGFVHHQSAQLDIHSRTAIPQHLSAAQKKASSRPPRDNLESIQKYEAREDSKRRRSR